MRSIFLFLMLSVFADDINRIAYINRLKKEAENAYKNEQYDQAVKKYSILVDSLGERDEKIMLNLSNAYYQLNDTSNAGYLYTQLTDAEDNKIKSVAYQQLGIMANNKNKHEESLQFFKNSLKADPGNEDARYNYELLKKMIREQQQNQQQQNQQQQDQQQQDQQQKEGQEQQDQQDQQEQQQQEQEQQQQEQQEQEQEQQEASEQENEEKEEEAQPQPQNLEDMKISEEMARKILEAMRNNEIQYLQQQKRKQQKPVDSSKPDW